ncbi:hypothetical protein EJ03DRAFT_152930 [Teratosphaeria nubilosa]|uniref:DUF4440 domain-containing protein n=1 Tax=Teratosphaeria nubilosa TaxID=161662 RepID=A0A6G1LLM2_9PEZI|nr:hypothetical protein EJ03DRAFT_152930 [Teratosphaeria nubilosa]
MVRQRPCGTREHLYMYTIVVPYGQSIYCPSLLLLELTTSTARRYLRTTEKMQSNTPLQPGPGWKASPPPMDEPKPYLEYLTRHLADQWLLKGSSWEAIAPHYASNVRMDIDGVVVTNSREEFQKAFEEQRFERQGHITSVNVVMKEGNQRADVWVQSRSHISDVEARKQVSLVVKWLKSQGVWKIYKITGFHGLDPALPSG